MTTLQKNLTVETMPFNDFIKTNLNEISYFEIVDKKTQQTICRFENSKEGFIQIGKTESFEFTYFISFRSGNSEVEMPLLTARKLPALKTRRKVVLESDVLIKCKNYSFKSVHN